MNEWASIIGTVLGSIAGIGLGWWAGGALYNRLVERPREALQVVAWWTESDDYVFELTNGERYRGSCTLWWHYDTGAAYIPGWKEAKLIRAWRLLKWGRLQDKRVPAPSTRPS